jgi:hypothetical protein
MARIPAVAEVVRRIAHVDADRETRMLARAASWLTLATNCRQQAVGRLSTQ